MNIKRKIINLKSATRKYFRVNLKLNRYNFIKKYRRQLTTYGILALIILTPVVFFTLRGASGTEAAWYDTNWTYRKRVPITNNVSTELTEFQVKVTLDTATLITNGKMQNTCADLRFTDSSGQKIPYWIQENEPGCNDSSTVIWVKVPSIPSSGDTFMYMYYGNPDAVAENEGDATFDFFDDFNGPDIRGIWNTEDTPTLNSGVIELNPTDDALDREGIVSNTSICDGVFTNNSSCVFMARAKLDDTTSYESMLGLSSTSSLTSNYGTGDSLFLQLGWPTDKIASITTNNGSGGSFGNSFDLDTNYNFMEIKYDSISTNGTKTLDTNTESASVTESRRPTGDAMYVRLEHDVNLTATTSIDWIAVRKIAVTEPTVGTLGSEEATPGPIAYWKFDEGADNTCSGGVNDVCDTSSNNNDGAKFNADWQTAALCASGQCTHYDGAGDYVKIPDNSSLDFAASSSFTVQAWIKHVPISTSADVILAKYETSGADGGYKLLMESDGDITFGIDDDNSGFPEDSVSTTTANYDDNAWHLVTGVKNGTTDIKLYVDGHLIGTDNTISSTGTLANNDNLFIGIDGDGSSNSWDGFIDEVKIYPFARTEDEIGKDYQFITTKSGSGAVFGASDDKSFLNEGLVGYWDMEGIGTTGGGVTIPDLSGSSYDGTTVDSDSTLDCTLGGKFGNACDFDGSNDAITLGDKFDFAGNTPFTVSGWINAASLPGSYARIVSKYDTGVQGQWYLGIDSFGLVNFLRECGSYGLNSTTAVSTSTWTHITGIYDGSDLKIYINGELNNVSSDSCTISDGSVETVIGAEDDVASYANEFEGLLDDIRIYNRALNDSEVKSLYNWAPGPVAHWKLDDGLVGNAKVIADSSGNGYNGTTDSGVNSTGVDCSASGRIGGACNFDGTDDVLRIDSALNSTDDFTISAWFKPNESFSSSNNQPKGIFDMGAINLYLDSSDGKLKADIANTTNILSGTESLDTSHTYVSGLNVFNGKLYATQADGTGGDGDVYMCDPSLTEDSSKCENGDWTVGYDIASPYTYTHSLINFNGKLYAGLQGPGGYADIAMCDPTLAGDANDCDNSSDWSIIKVGTENAFRSLGTFNGKLYAGQGEGGGDGDIYMCDPALAGNSNDCDNSSDWSLAANLSAYTRIYDFLEYEGVFYASSQGTSLGAGDILMCDPTQTGNSEDCDGDSDWSVVYDSAGSGIRDLAIFNGRLYFAQMDQYIVSGLGDIYVCDPTQAGDGDKCDNASDWSASYNGDENMMISMIAYGGKLYVAEQPSGDILVCDPTNAGNEEVCDDSSDWNIFYNNPNPTSYGKPFRSAIYNGRLYFSKGEGSSTSGGVIVFDGGDEVESSTSSWGTLWNYATLTKNSTDYSIYINGVKQGTTTLGFSDTKDSFSKLLIGELYGSRGKNIDQGPFNGTIDDITIYNYVRTQEQIIEDMNGGHPIGGSPVGSQSAYWKFDEGYGSPIYDSSPQGNDGLLSNSNSCPGQANCPIWSNTGKFGKSLNFDGTNDYVVIPDSSALDIEDEITVSAWIYPQNFPTDGSTSANYQIISKRSSWSSTGIPYELAVGHHDAPAGYHNWISFRVVGNDSFPDSLFENQITEDAWQHVVGVWDGSLISVYVNGNLVGTASETGSTVSNSTDVYIGSLPSGGEEFDGYIDEVKLYSTALTADQIAIEYNRGKSAVLGATSTESDGVTATNSASREYCPPGDIDSCSAPVGEWKFDENTGTSTAYDTSENANDGLMLGSMTSNDWVPGVSGSALNFDGTDDYVTVPYTSTLNPSSYTVSAWFKTTATGKRGIVTNFEAVYPSSGYALRMKPDFSCGFSDGQIGFWIGDVTNYYICTTNTYNDGKWHMATGVYDSGMAYLYIDGVLESSGARIAVVNSGEDFHIGTDITNIPSAVFSGEIDQVNVYNYARTPRQIAWEYSRGQPIGWWKFDECKGSTVYDSSQDGEGESRGNHGTIFEPGSGSNNGGIGTCNSGAGDEIRDNGTTGKYGASLDFDGTDDYAKVDNASEIDLNEALTEGFSISAWINPDSDGENSTGEIFDKGTNTYCRVDSESGSAMDLQCSVDLATGDPTLNITGGITTGDWNHVMMVWENDADDEFTLYINGVNRGTSTGGSGNPNTDANNLIIGGDSSNNFDGLIDDFKIFNYPLTPVQVKNEYNGSAIKFE